jgi:prolyl 4-hydroxylase
VGFRQSWEAALGALQHSAELGWRAAQRELAFLAGAEHLDGSDWNQVCGKVDIASWLAAPPARELSASPRIAAAERFASPATCDWLMGLARPFLKRAEIYDPATGGSHYESTRTNSDCHLILPHSDLVLALLRGRMANLTGIAMKNFEVPTFLRYLPFEEFRPHHDFLDDGLPGYAKEVAKGGQRVLTLLLYLNDGFEGGETDFPLVRVRFKGRKGDALFFWNVLPDGTLDRRTLHAGLPPLSGEKWLLSQWVRNRAV